MIDFWQLPGPQDYLAELSARIRDGCSVVLWVPALGPQDVAEAVRRELSGSWDIRTITADERRKPIMLVADELLYDSPDVSRETVRTLIQSGRLEGRLIWVEAIGAKDWPVWLSFVREYSSLVRNIEIHQRGIFVLRVEGIVRESTPFDDVALTSIVWSDRFSELDSYIYASSQIANRSLPVRQKRVLAECIAKLALWDWRLIERLAEERPDRVLDGDGVLREYGAEIGWTTATTSSWHLGTENTSDGKVVLHSAYLLLAGQDAVVRRRLWAAQAGTLLPLLEQKRVEMLPALRAYLRVPVDTEAGLVERVEDLEIGQIAYQIQSRSVGGRIKSILKAMRDARNDLAHLTPLSGVAALSEDLYPDL